jgi:hypothetical protein
MSEIDPWALPQGGVGTAGIPASGAAPTPRIVVKPLSRTLPNIVMSLAAIYAIACTVEIFIVNSQVSLANQLNAAISSGNITDDQIAQANASDSHIHTGSWAAVIIYIAALIAFVAWERRLKVDLGSTGARRAILKKAGYTYFSAVWLVSLVLGVFLTNQSNSQDINSVNDVINHDHQLMLYFGFRALLGVVLIFFGYRLMKISEDGVARLNATSAR